MLNSLVKFIKFLNFRTIWFNFHYLPLNQAIKLPVFISRKVRLIKAKGSLEINGPIETGMIKIGYGFVGIFDKRGSKSLWEVTGKVIFNGIANIGHGSKISVAGILEIGKNFVITAESSIVASKSVKIGDDCMFSWEILVLDTDYHKIFLDGRIINEPKEIVIGNKCWIGCRTTLLKGSEIPENTIVGAGSLVNKELKQGNGIYAGNPATLLKEGTRWDY
jgi:acetyltransferase-like isoleucine patch superfamily enzyme